jgi:hypothetical protein
VGVERGKTTEGFGACNEKTNYPCFNSREFQLSMRRSRLGSKKDDSRTALPATKHLLPDVITLHGL